jgi:hypothetical protein
MARRLFILVALLLPLVLLAPPAAAAGPFNASVTVVQPSCRFQGASGDSNVGSDGIIYGFIGFAGGMGCGDLGPIYYFQGSGNRWTSALSPYRGRVLATAWDGTATYLLYANGKGTHITKRTAAGVFTPGRRLSTAGLTGAVYPTGDVVAVGGKWWAVWTEQVGPGGEFAQIELFQGLTIGQGIFHNGITRQRITFNTLNDVQPSLTLDPVAIGDNGRIILSWTRNDDPRDNLSAIRFARAAFDGRWTSRAYTPTRWYAHSNDLFSYGVSVYGAYVANGSIIQASNPPASLITKTLARGGDNPRVGHSMGHTFVAWNKPGFPSHVRLAEIQNGAVTQADVTSGPNDQQLISVSGRSGKATVLGVSFRTQRLWAITEH